MKPSTIFILLLGFVLVACNKNAVFELEGRIMIDCETPLSDTELEIHDANKHERIATFKTNEHGYFKATYPHIKTRTPGTLQKEPRISIIGNTNDTLFIHYPEILGNKNVNFETLPILRIKKSFSVVLDVENPYDANHTLLLPDYTQPNPTAQPIAIAGPFTSGVLYNVENARIDWKMNPVDFTKPNGLNSIEVKYVFHYKLVGPNGEVRQSQTTSFGLQCETGDFIVQLKIQ